MQTAEQVERMPLCKTGHHNCEVFFTIADGAHLQSCLTH